MADQKVFLGFTKEEILFGLRWGIPTAALIFLLLAKFVLQPQLQRLTIEKQVAWLQVKAAQLYTTTPAGIPHDDITRQLVNAKAFDGLSTKDNGFVARVDQQAGAVENVWGGTVRVRGGSDDQVTVVVTNAPRGLCDDVRGFTCE